MGFRLTFRIFPRFVLRINILLVNMIELLDRCSHVDTNALYIIPIHFGSSVE